MDRVEITNVGGLQGLASEATLQQLLLITRKGKGDSVKVQELYNKSLNRSIGAQKSYTDETSKTEKALTLFQKSIRTSSARLSEFTEGIIGNSNFLTRSINRLTYYVDENIDRWRSLSQVGAGFNNNLTDIIKTSTRSNMSLAEFTDVVLNNAETLRSLGSTVTEGAVEFGRLSRELRRGFGRELYSMGFTFEEINEVLMSYMDINRRSMRTGQMSQQEILKGTQAYALELDRLTRLTGMSRRQAQEAMQQQMQDQRVRMMLSGMSVEEQARFQANLARANSEAEGFGEILTQLAAGDPGDEFTRLLRVFAPDLVEGAANLQNMSASEMQNFMVHFRERLDQVSQEMGTDMISVLSRENPLFAQFFRLPAQLSRINRLTEEEANRMEAEQAARNRITDIFGNFSEVLRQVTTTFRGLLFGLDEFGNKIEGGDGFFAALSTLSETIKNLFSPSGGTRSVTNVMDSFMGRIREIVQRFIGPTGVLTRGIRKIQEYIEGDDFQNMFNSIINTFDQQITRISGIIESMIAGDTSFIDGIKRIVFGDNDPLETSLSLWERFKNFVGLGEGSSEGPSLWQRFKDFIGLDNRIAQGQTLIQTITNWFKDLMFGEEFEVVEPGTGDVHTGRRGGLVSVIKDLVGMSEGESIGGFATRMIDNISNKFTELMNNTTATLRSLVGMEGDQSFGDWVKSMLGAEGMSIGEWFQSLIDSTTATLRGLIGMEGDQSFGDWVKSMLGAEGMSIGEWFQSLIDKLEQQIRDLIGTGGKSISDWFTDLLQTTLDTIEAQIRGMLGMGETETFSQYLIRMADAMTRAALAAAQSWLSDQINRLPGGRFVTGSTERGSLPQESYVNPANEFAGIEPTVENQSEIYRPSWWPDWLPNANPPRPEELSQPNPPRILGTLQATGQASEPKDADVRIHAGERVLNPQETRDYNVQAEIQRDMVKKLDELNTSMHTMISLMSRELAVQSRTMNSIRGLGTDLAKGIPG
jgi:hypothetical protein